MGLATPLQFSVTLFCMRVKTEKSLLFRDASGVCLYFQMEISDESGPLKPHSLAVLWGQVGCSTALWLPLDV